MKAIFDILPAIKEAYEADSNYFEGEILGEKFKIRMNKDHARNSFRNDDQSINNLSLVSVNDKTCRVLRRACNKVQWQIENIGYWEKAEEQVIEFLGAIIDEVE